MGPREALKLVGRGDTVGSPEVLLLDPACNSEYVMARAWHSVGLSPHPWLQDHLP